MLRFLVRTAVRTAARTAVRAAVISHADNQAREREAREAQRRAAVPYWLRPCPPVGETCVYQDARVGFSHAIPGFPLLVGPPPGPGEPAIDGLVALSDAPIWIRYRFDQVNIRAVSAMDAAMQIAQLYAANRTGVAQAIEPVRADRIRSYLVEAGATSRYALRAADPFGADSEELTVLVRDGAAIAITVRYPKASLDWVHKAMFDAVANATLLWNPGIEPPAPQVWPASTFLEPGLLTVLRPERQQLLSQIGPALASLSTPEKEAFSAQLGLLVQREEPPWHPIAPETLGGIAHGLMSSTQSPHVQAIARQAISEARTAHDLRGVAVWLGRAMG